jgi:hypothetical protein
MVTIRPLKKDLTAEAQRRRGLTVKPYVEGLFDIQMRETIMDGQQYMGTDVV